MASFSKQNSIPGTPAEANQNQEAPINKN